MTPDSPTQDQPTTAELRALRAYLVAGSTRDAARQLGCAESTVKNHLRGIRRKLGVRNTSQAVYVLRDTLAA